MVWMKLDDGASVLYFQSDAMTTGVEFKFERPQRSIEGTLNKELPYTKRRCEESEEEEVDRVQYDFEPSREEKYFRQTVRHIVRSYIVDACLVNLSTRHFELAAPFLCDVQRWKIRRKYPVELLEAAIANGRRNKTVQVNAEDLDPDLFASEIMWYVVMLEVHSRALLYLTETEFKLGAQCRELELSGVFLTKSTAKQLTSEWMAGTREIKQLTFCVHDAFQSPRSDLIYVTSTLGVMARNYEAAQMVRSDGKRLSITYFRQVHGVMFMFRLVS